MIKYSIAYLGGVYRIRNIINNDCYYGSTINFKKRWKTHKSELQKTVHYNWYLQKAWNKYGEENFKFEIVEEVLDKSHLRDVEQNYLDGLKPKYNISSSAHFGEYLGEKVCRKMHFSAVSRFKNKENHPMYGKHCSEEAKRKMSKILAGGRMKGENNGFYGKSHSAETKARMSAAKKGKKHSPEHRAKISNTLSDGRMENRIFTFEWRNNMSKSMKGNKNAKKLK